VSGELSQFVEFKRMAVELSYVAATEFLPSLRIVAEPSSKLGTWGKVLHPTLDGSIRFAHAARPQPVD
jgi:hypothetical protein